MSYSEALSAAGCEVLDYVEFGSYQGEWLALICKDNEIGWPNYDDNYEERLAEFGETYLPANTISEMIEKDISRNSYDYEEILIQLEKWKEEYNA